MEAAAGLPDVNQVRRKKLRLGVQPAPGEGTWGNHGRRDSFRIRCSDSGTGAPGAVFGRGICLGSALERTREAGVGQSARRRTKPRRTATCGVDFVPMTFSAAWCCTAPRDPGIFETAGGCQWRMLPAWTSLLRLSLVRVAALATRDQVGWTSTRSGIRVPAHHPGDAGQPSCELGLARAQDSILEES